MGLPDTPFLRLPRRLLHAGDYVEIVEDATTGKDSSIG
jgi:hypothetical protein